ncbi:arginase family protein [Sphingorhabdus sp. EL138]|uniref:arginase family protein n=1 Tax=Sphingorhabdus sp. EL138 TaxID=2073156 RepID=UPI000D69ED8D|nr:arginase family protein [Sphingorhabdus sp. EL138]
MPKMSEEKLERLRGLDRPAFDFADSKITDFFMRAMEQGYNLDTTGFLAHPGFFQAPHKKELDGVDIAIVGSPLDLGAIGLAGARHGPQAAREASKNYGPIDEISGNIPFEQCSIVDFGDVEWSGTRLDQRVKQDIADTFRELSQAGLYTLNCGGEHTTAFGALKGLSEGQGHEAFGLLHIDAHCDTMAVWGGDEINDGSVFRQAVLNGFVDPERTVQIGIRGRSNFLWEFSEDSGMTIITADEVFEKGMTYVIDKAKEIIGKEKAYLSLDIDGIDSAYVMGTTGPEPFGLSPRQVRELIQNVRDLNFVGADLVELNPNRDPDGYSSHLAAALLWELLTLLVCCRVKQTGGGNPTNWT